MLRVLRFQSAGESHGEGLTAILDGLPAGLPIDAAGIDRDLVRRQAGYGRGGRMKIEADAIRILGGVRHGRTLGGPIALHIANRDAPNWKKVMAVGPVPAADEAARALTRPRPGHADLAGALKYDTHDARDILERASARETAVRVAAGALAKQLLGAFGIEVLSHTVQVGGAMRVPGAATAWEAIAGAEGTALRVADPELERRMIEEIDRARAAGDSIGGAFEVVARGVPPGLGSHRQWDLRLSARLMAAVGSIPSVRAVALGDGEEAPGARGSTYHDPILYDEAARAFRRPTNRAGGVEGGMSNGEPIRLLARVKPLSTLPRPLPSADLVTKEPFEAQVERTDTIAIAAAGVVGEAMTALVLADAFLEKFGGDSLGEITRHHAGYLEQLRRF